MHTWHRPALKESEWRASAFKNKLLLHFGSSRAYAYPLPDLEKFFFPVLRSWDLFMYRLQWLLLLFIMLVLEFSMSCKNNKNKNKRAPGLLHALKKYTLCCCSRSCSCSYSISLFELCFFCRALFLLFEPLLVYVGLFVIFRRRLYIKCLDMT